MPGRAPPPPRSLRCRRSWRRSRGSRGSRAARLAIPRARPGPGTRFPPAASAAPATKPSRRRRARRAAPRRRSARASRLPASCPWFLRPLLPDMQHANERKEPPCGVVVELYLVGQRVGQVTRAAVVDRAARHVDRLELAGRSLAERLVVGI